MGSRKKCLTLQRKLNKVEKFGCLRPLEKMLKLRNNPSFFHSIISVLFQSRKSEKFFRKLLIIKILMLYGKKELFVYVRVGIRRASR